MKTVCYLADGSNPHTLKWCSFFKNKGYDIHVISLNGGHMEGIKIYNFGSNVEELKNENISKKTGYLGSIKQIKKLVNEIKPDILHAQYASSYGFIGSLLGYHPYIISVWGTDIYDFPNNGFIQKQIIKHNFRKADYIFSNSRDMAKEANKYTAKHVDVTFFGVDMDRFKPMEVEKEDAFVIGIIKSLEKKYGVEYLIQAFKMLKDEYKDKKIILKIGGSGSQMDNLINLAKELGIENDVQFLGRISPENVSKTFNSFDVTVFPSLREGFGVAAIESEACEVPVIVTNVGGHPESVWENETGLIVEPKQPEEIKNAIIKLMENDELRLNMGKKGRQFVRENYEVNLNFNDIEKIYDSIFDKYKK
ncbi:TPA: glycosyltransferase [Clostridioides difficile]|uniref:glycosyltransferase n=1 Tax=Clostridioides difficile TaxID=1496 RepID=UPI00038C8392|nr:glycosyltransferase [Clostridioides difficile]EGT3662077.1 glycosyltransferase family 4 protein [Clostridioides difficile]EGT5489234.1 glycosyltransferase family 4 protein [Clostridioides difficile]EGT5565118.1 glycosyltransferase family 4 protein [Clostridioides difficile]EQG32768.1 glycosyl transferases group 1 family protein [Clostridioides difficile DA00129]MBH7262077.1 glycosyltransferase [Clostridioides difficile]